MAVRKLLLTQSFLSKAPRRMAVAEKKLYKLMGADCENDCKRIDSIRKCVDWAKRRVDSRKGCIDRIA